MHAQSKSGQAVCTEDSAFLHVPLGVHLWSGSLYTSGHAQEYIDVGSDMAEMLYPVSQETTNVCFMEGKL